MHGSRRSSGPPIFESTSHGQKKLEYKADERVPDAGTFTFNKEGHTAGELLRMQLLRDHQVQYAGYQLPHPLEHRMLIKVQTTGQTAAPVDVLKAAIVDLQGETEALDRGFRDGVAAVRERQMQI